MKTQFSPKITFGFIYFVPDVFVWLLDFVTHTLLCSNEGLLLALYLKITLDNAMETMCGAEPASQTPYLPYYLSGIYENNFKIQC